MVEKYEEEAPRYYYYTADHVSSRLFTNNSGAGGSK